MRNALWLLLLCAVPVLAQPGQRQIAYVTVAPSGACSATGIDLLTPNGTLYTCQSGTWGAVGGGGGGVTSIIAGTGISVDQATGAVTVTNTSPGAPPAGSAVTDAQCWGSSSTFGVCISPIFSGTPRAAGFSTGGTPPSLTPGTGGPIALAEGTSPSVCAASGVDCLYADSTQHSILISSNNGGYKPLATAVSGGSLTTAGAFPVILTSTASTNVTLPTSGTLATTAQLPTVTGGTCTNQVVTAISGSAVPTCTTITSAYVNNSIALTGTDINTSNQVTATHLSAALPVAQGGTALTSGTSGGILGYTASGTLASSIAGVTGAMMAWGGAGNTPTSPLSLLVTNQNAASETWTWYNSTATTGKTTLIYRLGAGNAAADPIFETLANDGTTIIGGLFRPSFSSGLALGGQGLYTAQNSGTALLFSGNGTYQTAYTYNGVQFGTGHTVAWSNNSAAGAGSVDTSVQRDAAGVVSIYSTIAQGTTAANYRAIKASAHYVAGTTFTASGCSNGTLVGGATAGTFVSGTTGTCTVTITMGNSATAATGWSCSASDRTTPANLISQTASSTTTATISGTTVTSDVISFACIGY